MRKVLFFLVAAVVVLFTTNCGGSGSGGGNNPSNIEKSIYTQMQKGNYEKAAEIMLNNLDDSKETPSDEEKAQFLTALTEKAKQSAEAKGGINSFEITGENISEDGLTATVDTKVVYGDGTEKTETNKYVNKDGKWKLSMGK